MSTESLIIELESKVAEANKDLDSVKTRLDKLDDSVEKTDKKFEGFRKTSKQVGAALFTTAKATLAASVAMVGYVAIAAKSVKETENLSRTAKTTAEDFKQLAFAFSQVGVDAGGVSDAMNDVSERLGEFAAAGSGAFQDFADVMGLTKEEAVLLAEDLQRLKPEDAVREMVKQMEGAEVTGAQMSFVLKSLSNDLEFANNLFRESGKELDALKARYAQMQKQLGLTSKQAKDLSKASESFDLMTESLKAGATQIAANLAPEFISFFNWVAENVPLATNTVVDFINSFKDPESIKNLNSVKRLLADNNEEIKELIVLQSQESDENFAKSRRQKILDLKEQNIQYEKQIVKLSELEEANKKQSEKLGDRKVVAGSLTGTSGADGITEIDALKTRLMTEKELLDARYEHESELVNKLIEDKIEKNDLLLELEEEHIDNIIGLNSDLANEIFDIFDKMDAAEAKSNEKKQKQKAKDNNSYLESANRIGDALFEGNKDVNAGLIVANTAVAVTRALADLGPIAGPIAALSMVAAGATALADNNNARKGQTSIGGGGGVSSSVGSTGAAEVTSQSSAESGQNLYVHGIDPDAIFTGRTLLSILNTEITNGGRIIPV